MIGTALRLDGEGRLIDGDEPALAFNARAGGQVGAVLAVPALYDLAQTARRLGAPVARSVAAADGGALWDIDVRVRPEDDGGVRLFLADWRERARPSLRPVAAPGPYDWQWETDAAMRLTFVSAEVEERHGLVLDHLLGQPLTRLLAFLPNADGEMPILAALSERRRFTDQPARMRGPEKRVTVSAEPRWDAGGGFLGLAGGACMDGDAPAAPLALAQPLERALRGPLARIVADADGLGADDALGGPYASYAADIAAAGRHLLALIDDLADLEQVERPDLPLTLEVIDLVDLARRAGGLLAVRAASAQVVIVRPEADHRVLVRGDHRRTLQILLNLLSNAVRYSPPGGTVTLSAESRATRGLIRVQDEGPGIAPEDAARVFNKFERVNPAEPGGTGLGLYIARRLARAMGGDVTLKDATGAGAHFMLALPT